MSLASISARGAWERGFVSVNRVVEIKLRILYVSGFLRFSDSALVSVISEPSGEHCKHSHKRVGKRRVCGRFVASVLHRCSSEP